MLAKVSAMTSARTRIGMVVLEYDRGALGGLS